MVAAVWNTLHDGSIASVTGLVPGDVDVRVEIAYLCGKLPTAATHLTVRLRGCRRFEYRPFDGEAVAELSAIAAANIEILSAKEAGDSVSVDCVDGVLDLLYDRAEILLAEGQPISQSDLDAAADRYWNEWEDNARRARG